MQTEAAPRASPDCAVRPSIFNRIGRRRLLIGGVAMALIAAGIVWQWNWLVAVGVAPLLISAAPCLAMCALGMCMHRMGGRTEGGMSANAAGAPRPSETTRAQEES